MRKPNSRPLSERASVFKEALDLKKRVTVKEFNVLIERDAEGYYVASVPVLPGCHTQARSLDKLMERIREAIELYLAVENTEMEPLEFIGVQRVMVAR
jgi:predicted RNase H-like HicB family nuclease